MGADGAVTAMGGNVGAMNEDRREPVAEATNRDGLASISIMLLAILLIAFAAFQIIS